jgi:hypothetical protein
MFYSVTNREVQFGSGSRCFQLASELTRIGFLLGVDNGAISALPGNSLVTSKSNIRSLFFRCHYLHPMRGCTDNSHGKELIGRAEHLGPPPPPCILDRRFQQSSRQIPCLSVLPPRHN